MYSLLHAFSSLTGKKTEAGRPTKRLLVINPRKMIVAWAIAVVLEVVKSGQVLDVFLKTESRGFADETDVGC